MADTQYVASDHLCGDFGVNDTRTVRQITSMKYSHSGSHFVASSGSARMKLFDRDGNEMAESKLGDVYIRDQKHTKGHTGTISNVDFHPVEKWTLLTGSIDGTIRLWDVGEEAFRQKLVGRYGSLPVLVGW